MLCLAAVANGGLLYFFAQNMEIGSADIFSSLTMWQDGTPAAVLATLIVGALNLLLPRPLKEALVYWRWSYAAPGFRAFSVHARRDPRVNLDRLKAHLPELKGRYLSPELENKLWYRLYKQCEAVRAVSQAHRAWLLYRDLTGLSYLFLGADLFLWFIGKPTADLRPYLSIGLAELLLFTLAARNAGIQFVRNVLATSSI